MAKSNLTSADAVDLGYVDSPLRVRVTPLAFVSAFFIIVPTLIDLQTREFNLSILYVVSLFTTVTGRNRKYLLFKASALIILTYLCYLLKFDGRWVNQPSILLTYRLLNRSLVALCLAVTAGWLFILSGIEGQMNSSRPFFRPRDRELFDQLANTLRMLLAATICTLAIFCVFTTDVLVPGEFNLSILYALPLFIAARRGGRRLMWCLVPVMVALTMVGYYIGPKPVVDATVLHKLLTNRGLTIGVILISAILFDFAASAWDKATRAAQSPPSDQ